MDGVDFILAECGPVAAGHKAMAVNLSDIAAMAGVPKYAVVSLVLPRSRDVADGVFEGIREVAGNYATAIVGGDTNSWDGPLVITITVIGECGPWGPILRSGAKPGDRLVVSGPLGGSLRGRHLNPTPRLVEAHAWAATGRFTAMIDLSDGLATDLRHVCEASGVGAELNSSKIPIHGDAENFPGKSPFDRAFTDGEDFELLAAIAGDDPLPPGAIEIGRCTAEQGIRLDDRPLSLRGWEHSLAVAK